MTPEFTPAGKRRRRKMKEVQASWWGNTLAGQQMGQILTPVALAFTRALRAHPHSVASTASWTKVFVMDVTRPGETSDDYPLALEEPDNDSFGAGIFTFIPLLNLAELSPADAQRASMDSFFEVLQKLWHQCGWDLTIFDDARQRCLEQAPEFVIETTKRSPDHKHRAILSLKWQHPAYVCSLAVIDRCGSVLQMTDTPSMTMSIHEWSETRRSLRWLDNQMVQAYVFPKHINVRVPRGSV